MNEVFFKNEDIGYGFTLNSSFREITAEERKMYNIADNITTYLLNEKEGVELIVALDGRYMENDIDGFYEVCKRNMVNFGYQPINEEVVDSLVGMKKHARKLLCKTPDGRLQVSYFIQLSDAVNGAYALGCITANPTQDHGKEEGYINEMLSTWKYL